MFKMIRASKTLQVGLRSDGKVVINHRDWRDDDGDFVDAVLSQEDCRALGEIVNTGKIHESRNDP